MIRMKAWRELMCLLLFCHLDCLWCEYESSYDFMYKSGIQAYLENRWEDCVSYLEKSLLEFAHHRSVVLDCRRKCHSSTEDQLRSIEIKDLLVFFEKIVMNAYCVMKCEKSNLKYSSKISKEVEMEFENKLPYDYLQLCYFKTGNPEKAASCSYTFLINNPDHEVMQNNLRYYVGLPDVDLQNIINLEPKDYQDFYLKGMLMYTEKNYDSVIEWMEKSIAAYLKAEEECRFACEGAMSSAPETDFIISVANHFTFALRCKIDCPTKLSLMHGQVYPDLFANHFHYLQFAYYKSNARQLQKTCEAVTSYLLFHPTDDVMLDNKEFYSKVDGVQEEWFTPREEAVKYFSQMQREKNLLQFIEKAFQFNGTHHEFQNYGLPEPPIKDHSNEITKIKDTSIETKEVSQWEKEHGVNILMRDKDLNGSLRFAADGISSEEDCEKMISLASEGGLHGDGYNGKQSPHTEFEMFEGLTVGRAAVLAQRGLLDTTSFQIFLNVSEKARSYVEMYFQLDAYLHFAYTHLVCRTALPDSPGLRTDLSHPVHADNCVLTNDGQCLKQRPAYTWRDYSAIVYLNEDFEGGNFIFAKDKNTVQASVRPKCGRMVAFSAGKENLHGVQAVKKGRRCALAMWYTLDAKHKERERDFAEHVLTNLIHKQKKASEMELRNSGVKSVTLEANDSPSTFHLSKEKPKSDVVDLSEEKKETSDDFTHSEL